MTTRSSVVLGWVDGYAYVGSPDRCVAVDLDTFVASPFVQLFDDALKFGDIRPGDTLDRAVAAKAITAARARLARP